MKPGKKDGVSDPPPDIASEGVLISTRIDPHVTPVSFGSGTGGDAVKLWKLIDRGL